MRIDFTSEEVKPKGFFGTKSGRLIVKPGFDDQERAKLRAAGSKTVLTRNSAKEWDADDEIGFEDRIVFHGMKIMLRSYDGSTSEIGELTVNTLMCTLQAEFPEPESTPDNEMMIREFFTGVYKRMKQMCLNDSVSI
jgi:hypothetical protein